MTNSVVLRTRYLAPSVPEVTSSPCIWNPPRIRLRYCSGLCTTRRLSWQILSALAVVVRPRQDQHCLKQVHT